MRAVVQRVSRAVVEVDGRPVGAIEAGLLVYLGVARDDAQADAELLAEKIAHLRIFPDGQDKMNLDVRQAGGQVLVVSAFTTQADARKGRRPTFDAAARGEIAEGFYLSFCDLLLPYGLKVERGTFGALMNVQSINAGPVCILLDSKRTF
jgi:D-tyrosyl-tRNA(Tyr) deacylase